MDNSKGGMTVQYPKPIMGITELRGLGFSRNYLHQVVHARNQKFATMTMGEGKWYIDTEEFEKWRQRRTSNV